MLKKLKQNKSYTENKAGDGDVKDEAKIRCDFRKFGIILGVFIVFLSIVWITVINMCDDEKSGEDINWVG